MLTVLAACESQAEKDRKVGLASADSMAALRKEGKTDLSNPEMGAKVLVKLTDDSITISHKDIPMGQVTFGVENHGTQAHIAQIKGPGSDIKSFAIRPNETTLMAMILEPGVFEFTCPDSAGAHKGCGKSASIEVKGTGIFATPTQKVAVPKDSGKKM